MATVTSFTSERMLEIENTTIVDGEVQGDNLHLITREGTDIDAGSVRGPQGLKGDTGSQGPQGNQGIQGEKGLTGDVGELVGYSQTSVLIPGGGETTIISFTVPAFNIGDRLRLSSFGSFVNNHQYSSTYTYRIKFDGSIVGVFANLSVGSANPGYKYPWDLEYLMFQESANSVRLKGLMAYGPPTLTVDSAVDTGNVSVNAFWGTGMIMSNPQVALGGKLLTVTVQPSQVSQVSYARGFHAEHHHAPA